MDQDIPEQPEPGGVEVAISVATKGAVVINVPEIEYEPSDDEPVVEVIVKVKGSAAVSVDAGSAQDIVDRTLVGRVRHDGGEVEEGVTSADLEIEHG